MTLHQRIEPMDGPGRPTKLNAETSDRIIKALTAGSTKDVAAAAAGIAVPTFYDWLKRGEAEPGSEFSEFSKKVTRAIADAEMKLLSRVHNASAGKDADWRAAAWILERRHPERWANIQRLQILLDEELERTLDKLEQVMTGPEYDRLLDCLEQIESMPDRDEEEAA